MKYRLEYGKTGLDFNLSDDLHVDIVESKWEPELDEPLKAVAEALRSPIGSRSLGEKVQPGARVGIVFSDITRATPYHLILPPLIDVIEKKNAEIILFNATGTHRTNSGEELESILGKDIPHRYRIVQNDCGAENSHRIIGTTKGGNEVSIHREFLECDLKVLTGFIEPHFFAGFSGGGKAIMPGLAHLKTIQKNHGALNIDNENARWGQTVGNPIWEDILSAAEMVKNTFLLNVSMNRDKQITGVFAGGVRQAHAQGCAHVKDQAMAKVPHLYDIVITGNSGYPLDLNMYQAVKGMSAAQQIVKKGGHILLAADCWDGIPSHGSYGELLQSGETPAQLLDYIRHTEDPVQDMWQAQIHARICKDNQVHFYSQNLTSDEIEGAFMKAMTNLETEVEQVVGEYMLNGTERNDVRICVLPEGPLTIPYLT